MGDVLVSFPSTPHLVWLSDEAIRGDKLLGTAARVRLLAGTVVVEEKIDGANVGIAVDDDDRVIAWNRNTKLGPGAHPQFEPLWPWLANRSAGFRKTLGRDLVLFGEWCFARHSVEYTRLPDWWMLFDVWDRRVSRFWSTTRRDALGHELGLSVVPQVARGRFDVAGIQALLGRSRVGDAPMEGLYVRSDDGVHETGRAKIVRAEFTQAIGEHWTRRSVRKNRLNPVAVART